MRRYCCYQSVGWWKGWGGDGGWGRCLEFQQDEKVLLLSVVVCVRVCVLVGGGGGGG